MATTATTVRTAFLRTAPGNAFALSDTPAYQVPDFTKASTEDIVRTFGLSRAEGAKLQRLAQQHASPEELQRALRRPRAVSQATAELLDRHFAFRTTPKFIVTDVKAEKAQVLSNLPFALQITFQNDFEQPVELVNMEVDWASEPFTIQQTLTDEDRRNNRVTVTFDETQTLPVGLVRFIVDLYRRDGGQASFIKSFYVLPSNPLSLQVNPAGATVTGTWSARGAFQPSSNTFLTECQVTIANGDASDVTMKRRVNWSFWDGGIGSGSLVEAGSFDLSSNPVVPAYSVWQGSFWFSSPSGSGIYNKYHAKEDLALEIQMEANDGRIIRGQITCRVMLAYGVNIIKVGDFDAQEHIDLYDSVNIMRQIFEQRDITFRGVQRYIINNSLAGGYTTIDSETEFRNLLRDWSVANDFVDVYVCQGFNWSTFNGYAGDVPGPTSKTGNTDGVAVDKTGYTDALGVRRLNTDVLSKLIGHEVGHYLGLSHLEDADNLMRSNTGVRGPVLNYEQYRTMMGHGFMVFV
ncbi:zinc-dependent metalloprotease family protein [Larkinella insperata]|uniref:Zinc-dependent metalloprotease family protein n=1 Tax=Larkinella insperata TaxID=332158 RepID=A0ABW3Q9W5_9BACT|nr:zinc-dependent metalloprotease family protein [Larkinella insperata]